MLLKKVINELRLTAAKWTYTAGIRGPFMQACGYCEENGHHHCLTSHNEQSRQALTAARLTVRELRDYFRKNNYRLAELCLDLLMEKKMEISLNNLNEQDINKIRQGYPPSNEQIPLRKDKVTPNFSHEIKQADAAISMIKEGLVPKNQAWLGPAELLICATLVHDLGEDFNMLRRDLVEDLFRRYREKYGENIDDRTQENIEQIGNMMELLTHDREYKPEAFSQLFPDTALPSAETIKEAEGTIHLQDLEDAFKKDLMDDVNRRLGLKDLKVFATQKKGKPVFVVTRYGSIKDEKPVVSWDKYILSLAKWSPFTLLAKMIDRNEGLSSRIAVDPFVLNDYQDYLDKTFVLFSLSETIGKRNDSAFSHLKPLEKAFECADKMMSVLFRISKSFTDYYPTGQRFKKLVAADAQTMNFKDKTPPALQGYRHVKRDNHPLTTILRQFRAGMAELDGYSNLYNVIVKGLANDAKYWNIKDLIQPDSCQLEHAHNEAAPS